MEGGGLTDAVGISGEGGWITPAEFAELSASFRVATRPLPVLADSLLAEPGSPRSISDSEPVNALLVSGEVAADGSSGRLNPAIVLQGGQPDPFDAAAPWCLRTRRTAAAETLACFAASSTFDAAIPWYSDISSVALIRKDAPENELSVLNAGEPIALQFSSPSPNEIWDGKHTVRWSGTEAAGRSLSYTLLYSNDGGALWIPLATGLETSSFDLDTARIEGGADVRFRVIATSGLTNTATDVGPIEIRQRPLLEAATKTVDFGNRVTGETAQETVTIRNVGTGPVKTTITLPDGSPFSLVRSVGELFIPGGASVAIPIRYAPSVAGAHQADLKVNGVESVVLRGRAFAELTPNVSVGALVNFGEVSTGATVEMPVTIRNTGRAPLAIQSITGSSQAFQPAATTLTVLGGEAGRLMVRVRLTAAGAASGRLTIRSNDPSRPVVEVEVSTVGVAPRTPVIDVSPATLDFGNVAANSTRTADLSIANRGAVPLTITAAAFSNARFALASPALPLTIAPGAERILVVRFAPLAAGVQTGVLSIASNDPGSPARINLTGTGTAATGGTTPANFAGEWSTVANSTFTMTLVQTGANVTGTYPLYSGRLTGVVNGNVLTGTWTDISGTGPFTFTMAADGRTFSGTWSNVNGGNGTWSGTRIGPTPTGQGAVLAINNSPATLDFGNVAANATRTIDLSISNRGAVPLTITAATFSNARFALASPSLPLTVAPGANGALVVRFAPLAAGVQTAVLSIASNDPASPARVNLTGTGTAVTHANFAGEWSVVSAATFSLTLVQTGANVTGAYPALSGRIAGVVNGNVLTGTWTEPGGTGSLTFTMAADERSFTGTLSTAAGGGVTWRGTRIGPTPTGQGAVLTVDDGTFESAVGFPSMGSTGYFVNRLTPATYPATLTSVQIYFPADELPVGTAVSILSAANPSGAGGSPLTNVAFRTANASVTARGQWVEFAVPPLTINNGDFLVGFSVVNPAGIFPAALDRSPPARGRSYVSTNAASVRLLQDANVGNLGIRAKLQ